MDQDVLAAVEKLQTADPQTILLTVNNHTATLDYAVARIHADISRRVKPWQQT